MNLLVNSRTSALTDPLREHSMVSRVALWQYIFQSSFTPEMAFLGRGIGIIKADSLYFTYLANFGYPGLVFIVWLTGYFISRGFKLLDRVRDNSVFVLAAGITVMNITFAVVNITGTHIHSFPGDAYFWFWNGVLIALAGKFADKKEGTPDATPSSDT